MLKCTQVTRLAATDDYKELSFLKKAEYKFHLFMCSHCKRYAAQLISIGCEARDAAKTLEADHEQLERMEHNINEGLNGSQN